MKKKIIDQNTIEVLLSKNDLKKYGITVIDLLGNHQRIKNFFYKILEMVDTHHQFIPSDQVTFRVLPSKDGLELIINRQPNQSLGTQNSNQNHHALISKSRSTASQKNTGYRYLGTRRDNVIKLNHFENFIQLVKSLKSIHGFSNLYLYRGDYYLELYFSADFNPSTVAVVKNQLSIAYEYGHQTHLTPAFLVKNGKEIMNQRALQIGRRYFS